MNPFIIFGDDT